MKITWHIAIYAMGLLLLAGCSNYPRDPENTLQQVRNDTLLVGITHNPPYTSLDEDQPTGVEVALVKEIAQDLSATIKWIPRNETTLMEALKNQQLHLVVGGVSKDSPWKKEAGFTKPYFKAGIFVGVKSGTPHLKDIDGQQIGVLEGASAIALVKKKGGIPVIVQDLKSFSGPVAADKALLLKQGFELTDICLKKDEKVMALIKGENAWLIYLETYFENHRDHIESLFHTPGSK